MGCTKKGLRSQVIELLAKYCLGPGDFDDRYGAVALALSTQEDA